MLVSFLATSWNALGTDQLLRGIYEGAGVILAVQLLILIGSAIHCKLGQEYGDVRKARLHVTQQRPTQ